MCSCLGQGLILEWISSLFTGLLVFTNNGPTSFAPIIDHTTEATAVATDVNPRVDLASVLTLSVSTTAMVDATQFNNTTIRCKDAFGPAGGTEQMISLFVRFMRSHSFHHLMMLYLEKLN